MSSAPVDAAAPYGAERIMPVVVTALDGRVDVSSDAIRQSISVDSELGLPSRIETGRDGTIRLRQSSTSIAIAPRSDVEIPEQAAGGHLIARLIQHRGNVFYDVEPRETNKLRIETPYLVAVVKGTQFNVATQADSTTISLFEGLLEIRDPDGGSIIGLNAGQIAIRSAGENGIRILDMDQNEVPVANAGTDAGRVGVADMRPADDAAAALDVRTDAAPLGDGATALVAGDAVPGGVTLARPADLDVDSRVEIDGRNADVALSSSVDLGSGTADVGLEAGADLGVASADLDLDSGVDLGAGTADIGLDAGADLGGATADLGLDSGIDLGAGTADVGLDASADLGGATADLGLDSGVDLGAGTADVGLDAGADLGGATADLGLDSGIDLGAGTADVGVDTELLGSDVGLDVGVDLSGDDALLDVGLDTGTGGTDTGSDDSGGLLDAVLSDDGGGLLGPLL